MNTCNQIKRNDMLIYLLNLPDHQIVNASELLQTMTYSQGERKEKYFQPIYKKRHNRCLKKRHKSFRSLSVKVARAKQFKKTKISKIWASIRKATKIRPAQFQQEDKPQYVQW
ncbi:16428_t:CDS:2 [Racocetra persica]|uniref:16428_t:CDS:1 n=1 Tax=Racocetra persica TaxID=160502 RepID=A0ACA9KKF1_9GLOM|nr:16428_t:CDS:2 [Racocetra persica]